MKLLFNIGSSQLFNISYTLRKFILIVSLVIINTLPAQADLLITPTRVEFDQRERSAKVSLVNVGEEIKTYKIFWRQQEQLDDGRYQQFTSKQEEENFPTASKMIRYSPRQVTLKPGERQHIRIAVRRPKGLENGEYRSHLVFEALANKRQNESEQKEQLGIKLYVNLAFAIPILVRQGQLAVETELQSFRLLTKEVNNTVHVGAELTIARRGLHSSFGNLYVYWQDIGSTKETRIGISNNVAIYTELDKRKITISLPEHSTKSGTMRIVYKGIKEYEGITFIDRSLHIKGSDYHSMATDLATQ